MGLFTSIFGIPRKEKEQLLQMAKQLEGCLRKVNNSKTLATKLKYCDISIDLIDQMSRSKHMTEILENAHELYAKLHATRKALPVIEELKKAHKNKFKKKASAEKNNLLNALYEIKEHRITDKDFITAEAFDDETGEMISEKMIRKRLNELGWE